MKGSLTETHGRNESVTGPSLCEWHLEELLKKGCSHPMHQNDAYKDKPSSLKWQWFRRTTSSDLPVEHILRFRVFRPLGDSIPGHLADQVTGPDSHVSQVFDLLLSNEISSNRECLELLML